MRRDDFPPDNAYTYTPIHLDSRWSEFQRGVEVGFIAGYIRGSDPSEPVFFSEVRVDNAEMVMRIGEHFGRVVKSREIGRGRMHVGYAPVGCAPYATED